MQPIPFERLIDWIYNEINHQEQIFSIPLNKIFKKKDKFYMKILNSKISIPFGPAAGPHTQLAQNIICSYLTGARFFALKTVQEMDNLDIPKPCIYAYDEGYNTEWSTELTIEQAYKEYVKAWVIIHILHKNLELSPFYRPYIIFNISVGYNLSSIKTKKIDSFINNLKDSSHNEYFLHCKHILKENANRNIFRKINKEYIDNISPRISNSITLSTMHGCPAEEQESICKYLLKEKKMHTYVKLNPTLLGYEKVKNLLAKSNYDYIKLQKEAFSKDLKYSEAIEILMKMQNIAKDVNLHFGVKLSNTLPVINNNKMLPGNTAYMSGKSLFPLTINLAKMLASEFDGKLPISYSGGIDFNNIKDLFSSGIYPLTLVTYLLKPGGYFRLKQLTEMINSLISEVDNKINVKKLKKYAELVFTTNNYKKIEDIVEFKNSLGKNLPLFDCFTAPCKEICPINQDIPEYINLMEKGRYKDALEIILQKNPLPHITGYICEQDCKYSCIRKYYEKPVLIREIKKISAEKGWEKLIETLKPLKSVQNEVRIAIIGAGPAGLSAAYFLCRKGFKVTIFEKRNNAGGVVKNIIPNFRIPSKVIIRDIEMIKKMGVEFRFGCNENFSIKQLKEKGFKYIFIAIGAEKSKELKLHEGQDKIIDVLDFLTNYKKGKTNLGCNISIIGGGNSAVDAARAALRVKGVKKVHIVYRRTREYMPADKEELYKVLKEGAIFDELLEPVSFKDNILKCQKMRLGRLDNSDRRSPIKIPHEFKNIQVDTIISAIGERVDDKLLARNKIKITNNYETNQDNVYIGGDAYRGPASVVNAIADASKIADLIINKEKMDKIIKKDLRVPIPNTEWIIQNRGIMQKLPKSLNKKKQIRDESIRCLQCDKFCNLCVEVCPNRANMYIKTDNTDLFKDRYQIIHLNGICNECGNCATFCPYDSKPYKDKFTLFWSESEFDESINSGFILQSAQNSIIFRYRIGIKKGNIKFTKDGILQNKDVFNKDFARIVYIVWKIYSDYKYLLKI